MIKLNFDQNIIESALNNHNNEQLSSYLDAVFKIIKDKNGFPQSFEFDPNILDKLLLILKQCSDKTRLSPDEIQVTLSTLRSFRNYASNKQVQNYLINKQDLIPLLDKIFKMKHNEILKMLLQFLINLVVSNEANSKIVRKAFELQLVKCLESNSCVYESSALLYNLLLHSPIDNLKLIEVILRLINDNQYDGVEYLQFLLENFIKSAYFWDNYDSLSISERTIALELLKENKIELSEPSFKFIVKKFTNSSSIIFQTAQNNSSENLEAFECALLLETISALSSVEFYMKILQQDADVLINCGVLLINFHRLGKSSENCFSSIEKLADVREPNETIRDHPAFGFKADLVRLIGNVCWRNKKMQDLAREAEIILVLLDCCNIDARNPFIMQWSIFAIRNLCENNLDNQKIILNLHQQGTVNSKTLAEMGINLHTDGENTIKIVPLDSIK